MKHKIIISKPRFIIFQDGMTVESYLDDKSIENLSGDIQNFLLSKGIVADVSIKKTVK